MRLQYTLLTGATGLVGRYLMRDLALRGEKVAVLVRPSEHQSAQDRIEAIFRFWERHLESALPRPVCLEGDVTAPGLGLDGSARQWARLHCDRVIHNAAVLDFFGDRSAEPWRTNVSGTKNTLEFMSEFKIRQLHYVSTAYVCGRRHGVIREADLTNAIGFRNDYEESKYIAESAVRDADFLTDLTIYRPAVIAGDSVTGYTSTYHGLFHFLKLISVLLHTVQPGPDGRRYTPARLCMNAEEQRNIVPVDWVSAVICDLFSRPEAHGRTYHLSPERALTPQEVIEAGYKYYNSYGVEFVGPDEPLTGERTMFEEAFLSYRQIYESYETTDPQFDRTNLLKYALHLPCPQIDEAMLHRFWRYGEKDRWGKRQERRKAEKRHNGEPAKSARHQESASGQEELLPQLHKSA